MFSGRIILGVIQAIFKFEANRIFLLLDFVSAQTFTYEPNVVEILVLEKTKIYYDDLILKAARAQEALLDCQDSCFASLQRLLVLLPDALSHFHGTTFSTFL